MFNIRRDLRPDHRVQAKEVACCRLPKLPNSVLPADRPSPLKAITALHTDGDTRGVAADFDISIAKPLCALRRTPKPPRNIVVQKDRYCVEDTGLTYAILTNEDS